MTKNRWKKKITAACEEAGTYRPYFMDAIETLADILHKRDQAQKLYKDSGEQPVIAHTNKSGATNLEQHPALRLINDLNRDALTYWRDLGLTPAGLKRIDNKTLVTKPAAKTQTPLDIVKARHA